MCKSLYICYICFNISNQSINRKNSRILITGRLRVDSVLVYVWDSSHHENNYVLKCTDLPQFDACQALANFFRSDDKLHLRYICNDTARCASSIAIHTTRPSYHNNNNNGSYNKNILFLKSNKTFAANISNQSNTSNNENRSRTSPFICKLF